MIFLALKHLTSRKQQTFFTIFAVILGTIIYVLFSGMMLGFREKILDQLINNDANIRITPRDELITEDSFDSVFFSDSTVRWIKPPSGKITNSRITNLQWWYEKLDKDPRVIAFSSQTNKNIMISKGNTILGTRIYGIDPNKQAQVTTLEKYIVGKHKLSDLAKGSSFIFLGQNLMDKLGIKEGDYALVSAGPKVFPVKVIDSVLTGSKILDEASVYASTSTVQKFTNSLGEVTDLVVKLKDVNAAREIAEEWSFFTKDKVQSWDMINESILSVFKTQDMVRNSITFVIILIVGFGIYNILNMVVNNKKKDIAILRSMGYSGGDIIVLFLTQGFIIGLLGTAVGLFFGFFLSKYLQTIELYSGKNMMTGSTHMIISFDYWIYIKAASLNFFTSILSSFIPARNASKLSPIEIIRGSE